MVMNDRVTWAFENAGLVLPLDPTVPKDYLKAAGASGLGVAPTTVQIDGAISGGGKWRRTTRGSRTITMPVVTFGNGRQEIEDKLRFLVKVLQDTYSTPKLVGTYPNGTVYDTEIHYTGGADHQWGSDDTNGKDYCRWTLQLTAPDPYFTSRSLKPFRVTNTGNRGLLRGPLTKLMLTSSQALGKIVIDNTGDVESFPTWTITGPGSGFIAAREDGTSLQYVGPVNDIITINTKAKTITDAGGNNLYESLVGAPKFFAIPPGRVTLGVQLLDATTNSSVMMTLPERRELIF